MPRYKPGEQVVCEGDLYKVHRIWDKWEGIYELKDTEGDIVQVGEDEFYSLDRMTKKELVGLIKQMLRDRAL